MDLEQNKINELLEENLKLKKTLERLKTHIEVIEFVISENEKPRDFMKPFYLGELSVTESLKEKMGADYFDEDSIKITKDLKKKMEFE